MRLWYPLKEGILYWQRYLVAMVSKYSAVRVLKVKHYMPVALIQPSENLSGETGKQNTKHPGDVNKANAPDLMKNTIETRRPTFQAELHCLIVSVCPRLMSAGRLDQ